MPQIFKRLFSIAVTSFAVCLAGAVAGLGTAGAQTPIDPHDLYETRCAQCHPPHAHDLAKASLNLRNGEVVMTASGAPLGLFLQQHPRGLQPHEAGALLRQFKAMLETGFLYQDKCIGCHERASTLARLRLFERDGVIEGRYTYRDISEFLRQHGRLTPMEVETIMGMFHRQAVPHTP